MTPPIQRLVHDADGLNTAAWPVGPDFVTPLDAFFTRSHAPIPRIDPKTWRLEVGGLTARPTSFSLDELLRAFPRRQLTATLVCAGLRRDEFLDLGPLPGELPWGPEPASTGKWAGVALGDLLRSVGVTDGARYVELVGLDRVERQGRSFGFGGSIDLAKALSEVLLATELNGVPLPPAHGFPLRALVPGWIGARSVKWLGRITLRMEPSSNYFQAQAYRVQRTASPDDPRDVSSGAALSDLPVNAVFLEPTQDQTVRAGPVRIRGWAMGAGGRSLRSVELSSNDAQDWTEARLRVPDSPWSWTHWESTLDLSPGRHSLVVRATDSAGQRQPATAAETWNVKGYSNNAWHRIAIQVEP
jgi:sulfite oxidase